MTYRPTIPAEGNLVRTTSGDLVYMRENFEEIQPLVQGAIVSGDAVDGGLRGLVLGGAVTSGAEEFRIVASGEVLRFERDSGGFALAFSIPKTVGLDPVFATTVSGVTPTATAHLATKGYVDGLTDGTLSGLSDTAVSGASADEFLRYTGSLWVASGVALNDLSDVSAGSPASGEALLYNGAQWVNGTVASTLSGLTDTTITAPATDAFLRWNGSAWIDDDAALNDLSDVSTAGVASGEGLVYNGTSWEPGSVTASGTFEGALVMHLALSGQGMAASTWTPVTFSGEVYDEGDLFLASSGTALVAQTSGFFQPIANVEWNAGAAATSRGLRITKNGAVYSGGPCTKFQTFVTAVHQNTTGAPISVVSGDYFEAEVFADTVAAVISGGEQTWFSLVRSQAGTGGDAGSSGGADVLEVQVFS